MYRNVPKVVRSSRRPFAQFPLRRAVPVSAGAETLTRARECSLDGRLDSDFPGVFIKAPHCPRGQGRTWQAGYLPLLFFASQKVHRTQVASGLFQLLSKIVAAPPSPAPQPCVLQLLSAGFLGGRGAVALPQGPGPSCVPCPRHPPHEHPASSATILTALFATLSFFVSFILKEKKISEPSTTKKQNRTQRFCDSRSLPAFPLSRSV